MACALSASAAFSADPASKSDSAPLPSGGADWISLWNGQDLSGWTTWITKPQPTSDVPEIPRGPDGKYTQEIGSGRDPLKVFTVTTIDGQPAIRISGEAFGELRTQQSFHNYRLRLQFKWGTLKWPPRNKPSIRRDSGLLYHVHGAPGAEGRTWSRSIEFQIQEHDVGDLYAVGSLISVRSTVHPATPHPIFDYDPAAGWHDFSQAGTSEGRCVKHPDNENPTGEWNNLELVCFGQECIHLVNGKVVMRLHNPRRIDRSPPESVTSGQILLQSEGSEVYYREIAWKPITAFPTDLR